jgi:N-acetylneuraminic acid mutarotase
LPIDGGVPEVDPPLLDVAHLSVGESDFQIRIGVDLFGAQVDDPRGRSQHRDNCVDRLSLNDLWKFNPSAQTWTWVNGSDSINAFGVYGTQGAASAGNVPGARFSALSWTDAAGNLWLFGGSGFDSTGASGEDLLNDLWKYSPGANTWTWINGVDGVDAAGIYGTKGTAAANNQPGARYFAGSWTDHSGNFWLFGGIGYSSTGQYSSVNDLWKFTP